MSDQDLYLIIREVIQQYNLIFETLRELEKDIQENRTVYSDKLATIREQFLTQQNTLQNILELVSSINVRDEQRISIEPLVEEIKVCMEANNTLLVDNKNLLNDISNKVNKLIFKVLVSAVGLGAAATMVGLIVHKLIPWIEKIFTKI